MFTRVTTSDGDPAQIDEIAAWIRETAISTSRERFEGYRGHLLAADRATGRARTVSFWASEEALHASDEAAKQISQERSAAWELNVVSMDGYEVVLDERVPPEQGSGRFARVTTMDGDPERVDDAVMYTREKVLPVARELEGNRGMLSLVDRATGNGMSVTFWGSEEAMRASEEVADQVRGDASATLEMNVVGVERYEVVLDERF